MRLSKASIAVSSYWRRSDVIILISFFSASALFSAASNWFLTSLSSSSTLLVSILSALLCFSYSFLAKAWIADLVAPRVATSARSSPTTSHCLWSFCLRRSFCVFAMSSSCCNPSISAVISVKEGPISTGVATTTGADVGKPRGELILATLSLTGNPASCSMTLSLSFALLPLLLVLLSNLAASSMTRFDELPGGEPPTGRDGDDSGLPLLTNRGGVAVATPGLGGLM
mmetsp:Transcript_15564/g.22555  ORF Transcript_15564/g.22555 Transcript_15564/m.22555 type:complete len:228 (+) Transcript_15564:763-1446(+)